MRPRSRPAYFRSSAKQAPHPILCCLSYPEKCARLSKSSSPGTIQVDASLRAAFSVWPVSIAEFSNDLGAMRRRSGARSGKRFSHCSICDGGRRAVVIGEPWIVGKVMSGISTRETVRSPRTRSRRPIAACEDHVARELDPARHSDQAHPPCWREFELRSRTISPNPWPPKRVLGDKVTFGASQSATTGWREPISLLSIKSSPRIHGAGP